MDLSLPLLIPLLLGSVYFAPYYSMTFTLTIFACANQNGSSINTSGHAFVSFKNNSMITVSAGFMTLPSLGELTIGTWGNISSHLGVWYNIESHRAALFANNVAISGTFDLSYLGSINSYIINHNDIWSIFDNCSTFASCVWNTVSLDTLDAGFPNTPANLYASITSKSYYVTNKSIPYNSSTGYYTPNGTFVYDNGDGYLANTSFPLEEV